MKPKIGKKIVSPEKTIILVKIQFFQFNFHSLYCILYDTTSFFILPFCPHKPFSVCPLLPECVRQVTSPPADRHDYYGDGDDDVFGGEN